MYNLDVAVADTFYVGEGQWLVHNCQASIFKDLKPHERRVVEELMNEGFAVVKVPRSTTKTPDLEVNGVLTELKWIENPNTNSGVRRIEEGFTQGAAQVILDGRTAGLTIEQGNEIIQRLSGKYREGGIPGNIVILTNDGPVNFKR